MRVLDDPKKSKMLGELGGLAEKIASGRFTKKQAERALKLEAEIPWPHMNIASLVKRSNVLSRAEAGVEKISVLRKQLQKKGVL